MLPKEQAMSRKLTPGQRIVQRLPDFVPDRDLIERDIDRSIARARADAWDQGVFELIRHWRTAGVGDIPSNPYRKPPKILPERTEP